MSDPFSEGFDNLARSMGFGNKKGNDAANAIQAYNALGGEALGDAFGAAETNLQPFIQAGTDALPGVTAGASVGGMEQLLAEIFNTDVFKSLVGERTQAAQNQLSAGGLMRSGGALLEAARIPTELGLDLEGLINSRLQGLMGQGLGTSLNLERLRSNKAQGQAGLLASTGAAEAGGIVFDEQAAMAGQKNLQDTVMSFTAMMSDRRLKTNIKLIGIFNGLGVYTWDWIKKLGGRFSQAFPETGFMADEVEARYPQYIFRINGYKGIFYKALFTKMVEVR